MFNPLHDEVLAMILRQLKRYTPSQEIELFTGGVESDVSNPYTPPQDEDDTGDSTGSNNNEQNIAGLTDGFDYQLLYNDDEDLIGFTSHNGTVTYTLNRDLYEDLISVSVETAKASFKIALIFENYDMRVDNEYVEDKGKLIEVVILDVVDNTFTLEISPVFEKIVVGEECQFTAIVKFANGDEIDITNEADWTATSPSTVLNGLVTTTNSYIGTVAVTATYNNEMATAQLLVEAPIAEVPDIVEDPIFHDYDYKLVMRWESSTNTDMDLKLYSEDARVDVWYSKKIHESADGESKAWLDEDYTSHDNENDMQDKPEIITFKGFVGSSFKVYIAKYFGNLLTQNLTLDLFEGEDTILEHLDIQPEVFEAENAWIDVLEFTVTENGLEINYRITD